MILLSANGKPVYGVPSKAPFRKAVATAGTAVALVDSPQPSAGFWIRPLSGNTGTVYFGDSTVAASTGFPLENTDSAIFLPFGDPESIYLDADNNGDGVAVVLV